jgi:hypothetical protein
VLVLSGLAPGLHSAIAIGIPTIVVGLISLLAEVRN